MQNSVVEDDLVDYEEAYDLLVTPLRRMTVLLPKEIEEVQDAEMPSPVQRRRIPVHKFWKDRMKLVRYFKRRKIG